VRILILQLPLTVCLHLTDMDYQQLERFPYLASMLDYLKQVEKLPVLTGYRASLQGLLGILPDQQDTIKQQIETCNSAEVLLQQIPPNIELIERKVKTEFNEIFDFLNTTEWFEKNLEISKSVREHWQIFDGHYNELVVLLSSIDRAWRFPMVCINAQHYAVVEALMVADYVYMVDPDPSLMQEHWKKTELTLQTKLKYHSVNDFHNMDFGPANSLNVTRYGVPHGQMALVVCANIFERFTSTVMERTLTQIKPLLRPGGMIFFTVMDAEKDTTAKLMIEKTTSGITQSKMQEICANTGFGLKLWKTAVAHNGVCVVAQAPGELVSAKAQPSKAFRKKSQ
jgi:hypothetical protein